MQIFTKTLRPVVILSLLFFFVIPSILEAQNINTDKYQYLFPLPGSKLNSTETNIIIRFGEPIKNYELENSISVSGSKSGIHKGNIILTENNKTILFEPNLPFSEGENVTVKFLREIKTDKNEPAPMLNFSFQITKHNLMDFEKKYESKFLVKEYSDFIINRNNNFLRKNTNHSYYSIMNDSLPEDFPTLCIDSLNNPTPGYLFLTPFSFISIISNYLMIIDNYGTPIFYRKTSNFNLDFKKQPSGMLTYFGANTGYFYMLDSSYQVVDSFTVGNGYPIDFHELLILENNHVLILGQDYQHVAMDTVVPGGDPNAIVVGQILQELDENKNVIFQWRSWDHYKITDATNDISLTDSLIDYVHSNAIDLDDDGNILLSSRHLDEITKIDRKTGNTIWRWGGEHCKNNQFTFINDPIGFSHQHFVRKLPNGNISLFDNGNLHSPPFSRVAEYQLDEVNKYATLVWEYRNDPETFSNAMGSASRLDNHNTIIGWGTGTSPAISEVKPNGEATLFLSLPDTIYNYRGFKFPWKTNLFVGNPERLGFGYVPVGDSLELPLEIINNSDKQIEINGIYHRDSVYIPEASLPISLAPYGRDSIVVKFKPRSTGDYFDDLHLRWDIDGQRIAQVVPLIGSTDPNFTSVDETVDKPKNYHLSQNYPNPFNPITTISYQIPVDGFVSLKVYDILGKEIVTLVDKEQNSGYFDIMFNASNLASGIYFYRLQTGNFIETKKMILMK